MHDDVTTIHVLRIASTHRNASTGAHLAALAADDSNHAALEGLVGRLASVEEDVATRTGVAGANAEADISSRAVNTIAGLKRNRTTFTVRRSARSKEHTTAHTRRASISSPKANSPARSCKPLARLEENVTTVSTPSGASNKRNCTASTINRTNPSTGLKH